ncbi:putative Alpha-mannosidase [Verrucomicrobia bacterium]|nr:putative Alpha-mannosidase [Verrucomicrobiota bacterium]
MTVTNWPALFDNASANVRHWAERVEAELAFAEQLCGLHPSQAAGWRRLIAQGHAQINAALTSGRLEAIPDGVVKIETALLPIGKVAKSYTVHCIGHGHIDMNWMWSWPETVAVTVDTFTTVLRLMDEYSGFKFSQSQASAYAIVERHRPDLLQRIAQRVKEGRWEVTASHWVEGDKNMVSGESLCRHLLYARAYMKQLFALRPEDVPIEWAPDAFGHAATVPTYLARGGVKYLYLHRPGIYTSEKPGAFWWEGPDGSRVLVRNDMKAGYNGQITPDLLPHFFEFIKLTGGRDYMFVYGVGDHGGGPTRRDILRAIDMNAWPIFPAIRFSTARTFYERLEDQAGQLPVLTGEFNTEFTGCYTTETLIKRANRFAENRLVDAELATSLAWGSSGLRYPGDALVEAWHDTLFSHFHDILPGSGVHDTRTYTHGLFQKTMATTSQTELEALRFLAARVDTSRAGEAKLPALPASRISSGLGGGVGFHSADGALSGSEQSAGHGPRPLILFNPTARDRAEIVEATIWDNSPPGGGPFKARSFAVRGLAEGILAPQHVASGNYWGHDFVTLAFPVKVPGLGYAQYLITEEPVPAPTPVAKQIGAVHHCPYAFVERGVEGLENEHLRLEIDTRSGGIRSLLDKQSGHWLINSQAGTATLEYAVEMPHNMSAWCVDHTGPAESPALMALRRTLLGPYKAAIELDLRIHDSSLTLTYELRAGDPKLYLHLKGVWLQRGARHTGIPTLRFAFPLALTHAQPRYEIPFGAIDRSLTRGEEVPALNWAQVTGQAGGKRVGCLLLNDSKYGHSLDGSTLRLTLIRSSYDPDPLPEIGQHEIHAALQPWAKEMTVSEAIHIGQEFNHAVRVIGTDIHKGPLPAAGRFVQVQPDTVVLSAIKKAEDSSGVVVRLFNPTERPLTARIGFDLRSFAKIEAAHEVDLLERPLPKSMAKLAGNSVRARIPARGITSVLAKLG